MYIERQTRVSMFLHPSVSTITPGYRAWNKNHKTSYSAFRSRLPKKRKPLQKLLAACRVKEDHPTLCDDAAAQCLFAEQMCRAHPVLHRLAQRPSSVPASTTTPDEIAYDDSKNSQKKTSCGAGMSDAYPGFSAGMLSSSSVFSRIPPCQASHDSRKACVRQGHPVCVRILPRDVGCHGCVCRRGL